MRLFARYLTAALLAVALLALSFGSGVRQAAAAPAATLTALTLGAPAGTLTTGTAGSITYLVTVTKNTSNNNSSANLSLTWSGGAPTGVTTSFSPASVSWTGTGASGSGPKTSTLTISTTAATPAVTRNFTVRAQRSGGDFRTASGTLTVSAAALLTPTITFGAAPTPTYLGGNFSVLATTNSNGALSYSRLSGPCALVSGATFSSSGAGTCAVQASTAATSTYSAGSATQNVTILPAGQTVSFAALADKTLGAAPFALSATASSGLAVSFSSSTPATCTVSGSSVTLVSLGTCTLAASQAGDANFSPATPVAQSFTVLAAAPSGCTLSGSTRACSLWAKSGTISLPGGASPIPVWSYTDDVSAAPGAIGPTLVANAGENLSITLNNTLGFASSLQVVGLAGKADLTGVPSGGTKTYTYSNLPAGTYLYEAGIRTPNGPRQIAMGMVGALVVHEATANSAYGHSFDEEAVLVYSEIDPALNQAPGSFVLEHFSPAYLLINGKVYPSTGTIATQQGHTVLLRHVNAGIRFHSLGVLGLRQTIIADDAGALPTASSLVARTIGAGQTMDSLVTIPANVDNGTRYALYETGMPGYGPAAGNGMGGMLTFISAGGTGGTGGGLSGGGSDTTAPAAASITRSSSSSFSNASSVQFNVTFSESVTGVATANFSLAASGLSGAGVTGVSGSGASYVVTVSTGTGSGSVGLNMTSAGTVQDAAGNPLGGLPFTGEAYSIDRAAPTVNASLSASSVAVGAAVGLTVIPADSLSGVAGVTYKVGSASPVAMTLVNGTAQAAISTTGMVAGDSATVLVTATDAAGNPATQSLTFSVGDAVFANGFETGATNSTWGWSSKSTTTTSRLTVSATAAMAGTTRGLQASFGSGSSANNYVEQALPSTETQLHVRFYLNPHGQNFGSGAKTIFRALNGSAEAFRLEIRMANGGYQVRAAVSRANGTSTTGWQAISPSSANYVELVWASGASTQFQLIVNGGTPASLSNLLTSAFTVNTLQLGPQTSGTSGTNIYLDEFKVTRSTLIGAN